jgi:hypothetical protein
MPKFVPLTLLALASATCAASAEEDMLLSAQLSASALQCSLLAADKSDAQRLLDLGVTAGRRYVELRDKEPATYQRIWTKIPIDYIHGSSASAEFTIGRVYGILEVETVKNAAENPNYRYMQYRARNCALLK